MRRYCDWDKPFKEILKLLKKQGLFLFSIGNPITEVTRSGNNKNYFEEKKIYHTWKNVLGGKKISKCKYTIKPMKL